MPGRALHVLAERLRAEDSVVSPHVAEPQVPAALGELVAAGPATAGDPPAYALVIESVREGYLLHYGEPRVVRGADPDLRLLAGDYLYALGLERLAALGDLPAVRELSDLISLGAQLNAEAPGPPTPPAGEALWLASTVATAAGAGEALAPAKDAVRAGARDAAARLDQAATGIAEDAGIAEALTRARRRIDSRAESDRSSLG